MEGRQNAGDKRSPLRSSNSTKTMSARSLTLGNSRLYLTKKSDDWTLVVITDIGGRAYILESLTLDEAKKASTDKLREIVSKLNQDLALLPKT
jgi:hypothetical protein